MSCMCNESNTMTRCELLSKISEIQFICIELNLYTDTHPDDTAAMNDYLCYAKQLNSLIKMYEQEYGPLHGFGHSDTEVGSWVFSEWPWE